MAWNATCEKHICVVVSQTRIILLMKLPKLTKLELQIMEVLWSRGPCAIREVQEAFPKRNRPAYSTIQTTVYRLETKKRCAGSRRLATPISSKPPSPAERPKAA